VIDVDAAAGTGHYRISDLAVPDFHDIVNAISPSPHSEPGHVTFDVQWAGDGDHKTIRDETFGFTGQYVAGHATISFTATDDNTGIVYTSDPGGQVTAGGGIGSERNGVFFS
jgi:hypothetical protein